MFGRSASFALALLLFSIPAEARRQSFVSGSPIRFGFVLGAEKDPKTDFPDGVQAATSSSSHYFALQPSFDLLNLAVRLSAGWHFYPIVNGAGSDSGGSFSGNSSGGSFDLGLRVLLSPWQNESLTQRAYFVVGVGQSTVKLKNERIYTSSSRLNQTGSERVQGTGLEYNGGIGYEFFLLQNYSFQFETGYVSRSVDSFVYKTSTDVSGVARSDGEAVLNTAGHHKGFHVYSPYVQVSFNLHL